MGSVGPGDLGANAADRSPVTGDIASEAFSDSFKTGGDLIARVCGGRVFPSDNCAPTGELARFVPTGEHIRQANLADWRAATTSNSCTPQIFKPSVPLNPLKSKLGSPFGLELMANLGKEGEQNYKNLVVRDPSRYDVHLGANLHLLVQRDYMLVKHSKTAVRDTAAPIEPGRLVP
jgi:hypothetical protein